ncbi:PAS domain-containing protein [Variovorax sp. J22P168]|uniref:two-component system sensor histidine kinase NtrB n=1 Tax=Variovorax jilinensis TaxID=3053513 RepID=UPI002578312D|nr:ATP-binding protein [Variovorax sp. J22P168]MDM0014465.1 PAS domain-containing protein [Variovorax sp. J22P168]
MSEILVLTLCGLSGVVGYAALHNAIIGLQRPIHRMHLLFACMCATILVYVVAKTCAYRAETGAALVAMRRLELQAAIVFTALLPWFYGAYLRLRPRRAQWGVTLVCAALFALNAWLPWGLAFTSLPGADPVLLPWGERVTDLRVFHPTPWFVAGATFMGLVFLWGAKLGLRQYRAGHNRRGSLTLAGCMLMVVLGLVYNHLVNLQWAPGVHVAEFSFIGLVVMLDVELSRERRQSRERVRGILDNMPAAVYVKLHDGRYLMANRAYEELFDLPGGSPIGRTDAELFPGTARAEAERASDLQLLRGREPKRGEEQIGSTPEGEPRVFASLKFPLLDRDGSPDALCGVLTDVTALRRNEREMYLLRLQVWHADRVARTAVLAASLAHELSQPLTAILSNAQAGLRFLARDEPDLDDLREILQDVVRDNKRATGVINGLRTMLRRQETQRERVDIGACVQEVIDLMHSDFVERGIQVSQSVAADCYALADRAQIQQVVLNLAMNANEAMTEQPRDGRALHVTVTRAGERKLQVSVRDSGPGIAEEDLGRVFDHFYTTKASGLGMGLAMCRSILEAHGGGLVVERNAHRGVTFSFLLPAEPTADS